MKRTSVVVTSIGLLFLGIVVVLSNCSGGGGGDGVTLQPPAYNLTGNWKETQTLANNGCNAPGINQVTINYFTFNHQQGSNTVTLTDVNNNTANVTMSGDTVTYSAPMSLDTGGFCTSVTQSLRLKFTSASYGSGSQTVTCRMSAGGSCDITFNELFEKQ